VVKPVSKREIVRYLMNRYGVATKRACGCIRLRRSVYYYRSIRDPLTALKQRTREIAAARVRFGYRRILMLLRREGWEVGKRRLTGYTPRKGWRSSVSARGGTSVPSIAVRVRLQAG